MPRTGPGQTESSPLVTGGGGGGVDAKRHMLFVGKTKVPVREVGGTPLKGDEIH